MKITVELPDNTQCAFINYVFLDNRTYNPMMGITSIDTDLLKGGYVKCKGADEDAEKESKQ